MTTAILIIILLCIFVIDLRGSLAKGGKKLILFHCLAFAVCAVVLILHSLDIPLQGPSQWVRDLARMLSFI